MSGAGVCGIHENLALFAPLKRASGAPSTGKTPCVTGRGSLAVAVRGENGEWLIPRPLIISLSPAKAPSPIGSTLRQMHLETTVRSQLRRPWKWLRI